MAGRKRIFDPEINGPGGEPHVLSRTKIDLFTDCQRCFYLDQRFDIKRPSGPAFTLNVAVDHLLKKEFDMHRLAKTPHPLMTSYGLKAIPYAHEELDKWRHNFTGIRFLHKETNFMIFGAVDDVWINPKGELLIVDYKATSKEAGVKELEDTKWHNQYKRQMEIYQWLFRQSGFKVSDTGYFVYVNGRKDKAAFDGKLEFDVNLIPYTGNSDWVPDTLKEIQKCLNSDKMPRPGETCEHCAYALKRFELAQKMLAQKPVKAKTKKNDSTDSMFDI